MLHRGLPLILLILSRLQYGFSNSHAGRFGDMRCFAGCNAAL